jgi:branched-chain amino acid transport system permease protein
VRGAALQRYAPTWGGVLGSVAILALCPLFVGDFFLSAILTQAIWLGLTALSLIFLAGYVGMVSLAQVGVFGVAGFTYGNLVAADGGVKAAWNPWPAAIVAVVVAVAIALLLGAVASRSMGIYFLMITLAFGVIIQFFFEKVTQLSGFGGINKIDRPDIVSAPRTDPDNTFYISLVVALVVFLAVKYVTRTPFGIALQGVRDDPTRMRALGYNVELMRIVAFGFAATVAAVSGILFVWWSTRIDPGSVNIGSILDVLVVAVIGGLFRLEGAWVGAIAFVALDNYTRDIGFVGPQFNTLIGLVFLGIVLLSPGGLLGIWELVRNYVKRQARGGSGGDGAEAGRPAVAERSS